MAVGIAKFLLNPVLGFPSPDCPEEILRDQCLKRKLRLPQAHHPGVFLGGETRLLTKLVIKLIKLFFEGKVLGFFIKFLPGVAKADRLFRVSHLQEMPLNGVAVDLKGLGGLDDVSVVNHEPVEEIMPLEIIGQEASFPQTI